MAKKRTIPENIRRYKQEYLRLRVLEAKLNHQLYRMKKRIRLLPEEEQLLLSEKALLSERLQHLHEQKTDLESQPASKKRDTQLKRAIKEYKQVKVKHSRNQYQLDKLDVKKDKDNAVKLLLKEARRDDVRLRIEAAYETWMHLEQIQQYELAQQQAAVVLVDNTQTDTVSFGKSAPQNKDFGMYRNIVLDKPGTIPFRIFLGSEPDGLWLQEPLKPKELQRNWSGLRLFFTEFHLGTPHKTAA